MNARRGRPPKLTLDAGEVRLLATIIEQLTEVLAGDEGAANNDDPLAELVGPLDSGDPAPDPVTARLLPDAYRDDDEAAAEWRRLGRGDVRAAKLEAARIVRADLGEIDVLERDDPKALLVRLDGQRLTAWLGLINDARLALGVTLDIGDDWVEAAVRLAEDDPRRTAYGIYEWLTVLQDEILSVA